MKSRVLLVITALFFGFTSFGGGYLLGQSSLAPITVFAANSAVPKDARESFTPFWEVWNLIHTRYYDQPVDKTMLVEGAIDGMLDTLDDPNTRYLSPQDEEMARENMQGEIEGIGAEVESVDDAVTIVSPIEGSPAAEAGLEPGDIIREADGTTLTGMDLHEAVQHVRGPAGTAVTLIIERDGEQFPVEIVELEFFLLVDPPFAKKPDVAGIHEGGQLEILTDLGSIDADHPVHDRCDHIGRALTNLIRHLGG